ncbi:hypothetical protein FisN_4Hh175 [Fistulifera solaris]|uniref:rRNA-processing protein EFG1 n=1 Tax=Fistulifera solaris TaxID=1519565 RepID=A0A1Z5K8V3_FISSO|nr:hypothetical protein FisN_4Hh175 [Fistulifera solaris]|eukprot:GAX22713.1 hypothetical protein FisN_4Hh175 [Fistulifera solaris]
MAANASQVLFSQRKSSLSPLHKIDKYGALHSITLQMVKAPSSHALDRKFKPWRRGKSQNSNKRSSLKQQLRGHERLLKKSTDDAHRQSLLQKIEELKHEIANKEVAEKERKNAKQSHGSRFLERQKLVRMQHNAQKEENSEQLDRVALDQIYVGHFPLDTKYLCLFRNGQRRKDPLKVLSQRSRIRHRILYQQLALAEHKDWISEDQYARVENIKKKFSAWTVQEERTYFGQEEDIASNNVTPKDDSRFTAAPQHEAVLAAAEQIEKELENEADLDSHEEDESSSDSESEIDPLQSSVKRQKESLPSSRNDPKENDSTADSSSDDSSTGSNSSGESNSNRRDIVNEDTSGMDTNDNAAFVADEDDDFFVDLDDKKASEENPFFNPRQNVEPFIAPKGDKSKGWSTQKQRPGQWQGKKDRPPNFKKRRGNHK